MLKFVLVVQYQDNKSIGFYFIL